MMTTPALSGLFQKQCELKSKSYLKNHSISKASGDLPTRLFVGMRMIGYSNSYKAITIRINDDQFGPMGLTTVKKSLWMQNPPWPFGKILKAWLNANWFSPSICKQPFTKTKTPPLGACWTSDFISANSMVLQLRDSIFSFIYSRPSNLLPEQVIWLTLLQKLIRLILLSLSSFMVVQYWLRKFCANWFSALLIFPSFMLIS